MVFAGPNFRVMIFMIYLDPLGSVLELYTGNTSGSLFGSEVTTLGFILDIAKQTQRVHVAIWGILGP